MRRFVPLGLLLVALLVVGSTGEARTTAARATTPTLSGRLYFQRGAFIYTVDAGGSDAVQLTHTGTATDGDRGPNVSPDGRTVAYAQNSSIYLIPAAGGSATRVGRELGANDPVWSHDGTKIAFSYINSLYFPKLGLDAALTKLGGLWVVTAATGATVDHYENVTNARFHPAWAPGDTALIAAVNLTNAPEYYQAPEHYGITQVDLVSHHGSDISRDLAHDYFHPALSPDGQFIACIRYPHAATHTSGGVLWVMRLDGSGGHQVIGPSDDGKLAWSPDGRLIAFNRGDAIYAVPVAGGPPTLLVPNAKNPAWSGTGSSTGPGTAAPSATTVPAPTPATSATAIPHLVPTTTPATSSSTGLVGIAQDLASKVSFIGLVRTGTRYHGTTVVYPGESMRFMIFRFTSQKTATPRIRLQLLLPGHTTIALTPTPKIYQGQWLNSRIDYTFPATAALGPVTEQMTFQSGATWVTLTLHVTLAHRGAPRTLH